jgi:RNA polymerase sigma factor (sigma-70 family)
MADESPVETEKLLAEVSRTVRAVLSRKFPTLTWNEREDIEQEVGLKLWKIRTHGKKIDNPGSYLWKVVYTTTLDLLDGKGREIPLDEVYGQSRPEREPGIESGKADADRRIDFERRLGALARNRRIVIKLGLAGLDFEEIAAHLGWSPARVRHLHYRGLKDLKKMIEQEGGNGHGRR